MTSNKYTVNDSFAFPEKIVGQNPEFFMGNLDVDSLFTKILLEETTEICTNIIFENTERIVLSKIEFKGLLSDTTKETFRSDIG